MTNIAPLHMPGLALLPFQERAFKKFSPELQHILESLLIHYRFSSSIASSVLAISNRCSDTSIPSQEAVFTQLLQDTQRDASLFLDRLKPIVEKGWGDAFFSCATTKKGVDYPLATLEKILSAFETLIESVDASFSPPHKFPCYDEGGDDLLLRAKDNSRLLIDEFQKERIKPLSTSDFSLITNRKALLSSSLSFSRTKSAFTAYLSSIPEGLRGRMDVYLKAFGWLEKDPEARIFSESIKVALIHFMTAISSCEVGEQHRKITFADFEEIISLFQVIQNKSGEEPLLLFSHAEQLGVFDLSIRILSLLKTVSGDLILKSKAFESLKAFSKSLIVQEELLKRLEELAPETNDKAIQKEQDISLLMSRFVKEAFPLPEKQQILIAEQYTKIQMYCDKWSRSNLGRLIELAAMVKDPFSEEGVLQLIAIGRLAIYIKFQLYLHNTQVLTVLAKLSYTGGCVAQVKTGEGKSMTIALLAFVLALQKKSVHIISSSPNLSIRDQELFFSFFKAFAIPISHICTHFPSAPSFQAQILYGVASDFEFALMREMLYSSSLFITERHTKNKRFDCVIIDELDNLTIDTARSGARLSYPSLVSYNWIYFPIFQYVKKYLSKGTPGEVLVDIGALRKHLMSTFSESFRGIIDTVSNEKLLGWLSSAHNALYKLELNKHYVVFNNRKMEKKEICIVDAENTGRLMHGTRWGKGLHEFVELKHGIEPQEESVAPISFNHAVYYEMYENIYGLTGTLGSKTERAEIKEVYGIEAFDVPTYHPCIRYDLPPHLFSTDQKYFKAIINRTRSCISTGRPILILCETISVSNEINTYLKEEGIKAELLNEVQEKLEEQILSLAGRPGGVTVATNTAGRGTDVKLDPIAKKNGGLHVLLTFFPVSERVEGQARGRAGRQGDPGSSEIFISKERLEFKSVQELYSRRVNMIEIMKFTNVHRAHMHRYIHELEQRFYILFKEFRQTVKEERYLFKYSTLLVDRKVVKALTPQHLLLSYQEKKLSEKLISLLTGRSTLTDWESALVEMRDYLIDKMLNQWALEFRQKVESMIENSSIEKYAMQMQNFRKASPLLAVLFHDYQSIEKNFHKEIEEKNLELRKQIDACFKEFESKCNKYLAPQGIGLIEYIRELTGAVLPGI